MLVALIHAVFVEARGERGANAMTASERKTIVVAGATELQGGAVARRLLQDGWRVRGLTRDAESNRARVLSALGAEVVQGDIGDADSLRPLFEGAYGVYGVQNPLISGPEAEEIRLLTLTGPGGSGQTRLVLKVARDLVDEFEDGVWLAYPRDLRRRDRDRLRVRKGARRPVRKLPGNAAVFVWVALQPLQKTVTMMKTMDTSSTTTATAKPAMSQS